MRHLSPDQVVDVAEGCADAAVAAHAAACPPCRAKAESLLDAVRLAEADPRVEPSPLFWPHLAARIGDAVRREGVPVPFWRSWGWRLAPIGAAAVLLIAVGIGSRTWTGLPGGGPLVPAMPDGAPVQVAMEPAAEIEAADDPSWLLVSALSADVSIEETEASGSLPPPGGADRALPQLDGAERMELARILRAEIRARGPVAPQGPGA